jgi:hypothetical protein
MSHLDMNLVAEPLVGAGYEGTSVAQLEPGSPAGESPDEDPSVRVRSPVGAPSPRPSSSVTSPSVAPAIRSLPPLPAPASPAAAVERRAEEERIDPSRVDATRHVEGQEGSAAAASLLRSPASGCNAPAGGAAMPIRQQPAVEITDITESSPGSRGGDDDDDAKEHPVQLYGGESRCDASCECSVAGRREAVRPAR